MRRLALELSAENWRWLKAMVACGIWMAARKWRRIRTLLLLAEGMSARAAAPALGTHAPRAAGRNSRPDYHAQPQCLVDLGCAAARWPGVPNPKPVARCANRAPALTVAA